MSGYSESVDCPRCGSKESLERSIDQDDVMGICPECGYEYHTVYSILSLEAVNQEREAMELKPLKELKKPMKGWKD